MSAADTAATLIALAAGSYAAGRVMWRGLLRAPVASLLCAVAPDAAVRWGLGIYDEPSLAAPDYSSCLVEAEADIDDNAPLSVDEWSRLLNDKPDVIPHLAVYGPSGSGKSTLILALLASREGQLVITTIKNAQDDPWGGFPAVRLGFTQAEDGSIEPDWRPIGAAIEAVYREVNARHADGRRPRTPLTLVIDELTATIGALGAPRIVPRLIHMWLTARSVGVRLIVGDPTANVGGWGLRGRGDVRESIGFIRCDRDKSAMLGELDECRAGDGVWLDTHRAPALAAAAQLAERVWRPLSPVLCDAGYSAMDSAIAPLSASDDDSIAGDAWEAEVYRRAHAGESTRQIRAALGGNYNRIVELARAAREER